MIPPLLVSVIVPAYNRRQFISETVESVLAQTYREIEVVVVDDGSTDGTGELLKSRYLSEPRFRYIWQQNAERAVARNTGIRESKGDYIAFLDSDDLWLPQKLELQMQCFAKDKQLVLVHSAFRIVDESLREVSTFVLPDCEGLSTGHIYWQMIRKDVVGSMTPVVRREGLERAGLFNEDRNLLSFEDWEMWTRLCYRERVGYVAKPLALYRRHPGNAGYPPTPGVYARLLKEASKYVAAEDRKRLYREATEGFLQLTCDSLHSGNRRVTYDCLGQAIRSLGASFFLRSLVKLPKVWARLAWESRGYGLVAALRQR